MHDARRIHAVAGLAAVLIPALTGACFAGGNRNLVFAQSSFGLPQPSITTGGSGAADQLIGNVPGVNALTPEQVERLGRDAAQDLGRSRTLYMMQQADRLREARRRRNLGPRNEVPAALDCDDTRRSVHPGAAEICNGIDDDCDGLTDEDLTVTIYADIDGDSFGDPYSTIAVCLIGDALQRLSTELAQQVGDQAPGKGARYVLTAGDCDDRDPEINPLKGRRCDR